MPWRWGLGGLALLVLAMFLDTLVAADGRVIGALHSDVARHTLPWRAFGFGELAKGNFALWNPHVYGGAPYFGGQSAALLYPPNALFLALPLALATNWSVALNAWLLGAFMFLWALRRGLAPLAAFVAAALILFCAPHFLRVQLGPVTNLATMAWVPLLFLAIDEWLASRRPLWCLLGMLAVAMQILAGQPQYVYYTALVAAAYSGFRLLEAREGRLAAAAGLLSLHLGGAALAAVQLLAGFEATAETVRAQALPYRFAASFSFPPENLVTLLVPGFFGDVWRHPYWGRWYLWEASAFIGVTGLALAAYGIAAAKVAGKRSLLAACAAALLLAFGDNTPLYGVLYEWLPWYDRFRATGKFIFLVALILALFAGCGLDRILRDRTVPAPALWTAGASAAVLLAAAAAARAADWQPLTAAMIRSGESYAQAALHSDPAFASASGAFASLGLLAAGLTLAATAGLALWTRRQPRAALLIGALAVVEVFVFARQQRVTFDSTRLVIPQLRQVIASQPGDYRILDLNFPNGGVFIGARDAWGYDPAVTRRYAELVHWSAGHDPALAMQYVSFDRFHPLLAMLRVKYVVEVKGDIMTMKPLVAAPLAQVELVGGYQVRAGREAVLRALGEPSFDPRKEVVLEREPRPAPVAAARQGRAAVVRQGSDYLDIDADVASPSVLLVTDAWTPSWRARALAGSSATEYEVMPANYALRGIPLERGRHLLRLEYAPAGFRIGILISALAWLAWLGGAVLLWRRGKAAHA